MATAVDVKATPQRQTDLEDQRNWTDYVLVYEQSKVEEDGKEEADRLESMRKKFEENLKKEGLQIKRPKAIEDTAQLVS